MNPKTLRFAKYFCTSVFILLILFALSNPVKANDNHIYLGAWSFHSKDEWAKGKEYNETNELYAIQYNKFFVGTFNNSYYERTYAAGLYFPTDFQNTIIEVSAIIGVTHGYKECYGPGDPNEDTKTCFLLMPEFTLNVGKLKPSLTFLSSQIAVLSIKTEF